jgi:ketosteroid isomerase-like protein
MPILLAGCLFLAASSAAPPASPFSEVVAAERTFAAQSPAIGFHAAFVANFTDDGVVFTPVPANAKAAHKDKPRAPGTLSWGPAWVAAPASGDIAFSSGPWEYRNPADTSSTPATGWFFTAWRKQADGRWLVEADLGVDAPLTYVDPAEVEDGLGASSPAKPSRPRDAAAARGKIASAEHALGAAGASALGPAVAAVADPSIRVYRDGSVPARGRDAGGALLIADARKATCVAARVAAAGSGDLGYAYGTCTPAGGAPDAKPFGYLRVWRRQGDGSWKVFVDVTP